MTVTLLLQNNNKNSDINNNFNENMNINNNSNNNKNDTDDNNKHRHHHHHHHSYKFTTEALETLPWPPEGIRQRWPSVRTRSDLGEGSHGGLTNLTPKKNALHVIYWDFKHQQMGV